jgi:brefeldin A-resistance guanine nucleotide exchange factor 1
MSRQFQNLLSLDPGADGEQSAVAEHQLAEQQRTLQMVEACKIDDLFTDSKFPHKASLLELVKALINVSGKPHQKTISTDKEDTALFCLDLLIAVTRRNQDRILLLW